MIWAFKHSGGFILCWLHIQSNGNNETRTKLKQQYWLNRVTWLHVVRQRSLLVLWLHWLFPSALWRKLYCSWFTLTNRSQSAVFSSDKQFVCGWLVNAAWRFPPELSKTKTRAKRSVNTGLLERQCCSKSVWCVNQQLFFANIRLKNERMKL